MRSIVVTLLVSLSTLLAAPAVASAPLPSLPHYFYGTLKIDGVDTPAGTRVEARVAGVLTGSFNPVVTTQVGKYGDANPSANVPRLLVQGNIADGATIEFFVNGAKASETAAWHSGQATLLNLTARIAQPAAPLNLIGVAAAVNQVTLVWTDNSTNETGFRIERSTGGASFTPVATVGANVNTYLDTTVLPQTTYQYRVFAYSDAGDSATGGPVTVTTPATPVTVPDAPINLVGTAAAHNQVYLSWTDGSANETGFRVERAAAGGGFVPVGTIGANIVSFSDLTTVASTTYQYRLFAFNGAGDSALAGPVTVVTPAAQPQSLGGGGGAGAGGGPPPASGVMLSGLTADGTLSVSSAGVVQNQVRLTSSGPGKASLDIAAGTMMKRSNGTPLTSLFLSPVTVTEVPAAPPQSVVVHGQVMGPDGATFDPPIIMTMTVDPATLPAGITPKNLVIAFWDGAKWVSLETSLNAATNSVSAKVSHFTVFGIMAKTPAPEPNPSPRPTPSPTPSLAPAPVASPKSTPVVAATPPSAPPPTIAPTTPPAPAPLPKPAAPPEGVSSVLAGGFVAALIAVAVLAILLIKVTRRRTLRL